MRKFFLLSIAFISLSILTSAQNISQKWISCYTDHNFMPTDMVTDKAGNTFVTGYSYEYSSLYDNYFYLLKTDAEGNTDWVKTFPGSADSLDQGIAVALDASGNVVVVGRRFDTICNICSTPTKHSDVFILNYDTAGTLNWMTRYNGPDTTLQTVQAMTIGADGSIYLLGSEDDWDRYNYNTQLFLVKLNSAGEFQWVKRSPSKTGYALTTDANNNVLMAASDNSSGYPQFFTMKFNSRGDSLWAKTYYEYNKRGTPYFIETDAKGNVYVNGESDTNSFYNIARILTVKYDSAGTFLWKKKEPNETYTMPHTYGAFTIDDAGNVYVAGYIHSNSILRDWITTKYNTNGTLKWSRQFAGSPPGSDVVTAMLTDAFGNVYVAGNTNNKNNKTAYGLVKYDKDGNQQWEKYYNANGKFSSYLADVGIDGAGNIYVTGQSGIKDSLKGGVCTIRYGDFTVTGMEDVFVTGLRVYPNPSSGKIEIKMDELSDGATNLSLYNNIGQRVLNQFVYSKEIIQLDIKNQSPGIYLLQIQQGNLVKCVKVIKE